MTHAVFALIGIGFLVGFRHAFEPDHLAAVSTLASRHGWRTASGLGVAWGFGHTASVGVVGLIISLLGIRVPDAFFRAAELGVAFLLIALGVSTLAVEARRHRRQQGAAHEVAHEVAHAHRHPHSHAHLRTVRSAFGFGIAHGLAGSGAVMVLIVAAASSPREQLLYLLVFGIGTILGMSIVSLMTGAVTGLASARNQRVGLAIRVGAACASTAVGVWLGAGVIGRA